MALLEFFTASVVIVNICNMCNLYSLIGKAKKILSVEETSFLQVAIHGPDIDMLSFHRMY